MNIDKSLAESFMSSVEDAAESARSEAENKTLALREKLRARLGTIVDDFARETEPFMQAIASLPEKDGIRFELSTLDSRKSTIGMDITLKATRETRDGKTTSVLGLEAMNGDAKQFISISYDDCSPGGSKMTWQDPIPQNFADTRSMLARWFARVAPERIGDLKAALLPDEAAPQMALEKNIRIDSPLKLKTSPAQ